MLPATRPLADADASWLRSVALLPERARAPKLASIFPGGAHGALRTVGLSRARRSRASGSHPPCETRCPRGGKVISASGEDSLSSGTTQCGSSCSEIPVKPAGRRKTPRVGAHVGRDSIVSAVAGPRGSCLRPG